MTETEHRDHAGGALLVERRDGILRVIFNAPERLNAVNLACWEALGTLCREVAGDDSIRVVTFEGAGGRAFVSGADIAEFDTMRADPASGAHYDRAVHEALSGIASLPVPSLALVEGYCIGGGLEIAFACDIRLASETAQFALTPAKLGLGFDYDGIALIERVAGEALAADLLFTARRMTAEEAHMRGICSRVVAADSFATEGRALAERIAGNAPLTIRAIKAGLLDLRRAPADRQRGRVDAMVRACLESDDYREGRAAFAEKRKPGFTGR